MMALTRVTGCVQAALTPVTVREISLYSAPALVDAVMAPDPEWYISRQLRALQFDGRSVL